MSNYFRWLLFNARLILGEIISGCRLLEIGWVQAIKWNLDLGGLPAGLFGAHLTNLVSQQAAFLTNLRRHQIWSKQLFRSMGENKVNSRSS